jgi:hypothetical protein
VRAAFGGGGGGLPGNRPDPARARERLGAWYGFWYPALLRNGPLWVVGVAKAGLAIWLFGAWRGGFSTFWRARRAVGLTPRSGKDLMIGGRWKTRFSGRARQNRTFSAAPGK